MGRILGLDPGSRRCGVAITDSARSMAFPRPALEVGEHLPVMIGQLVEEESVDLVVVGRPVALSGRETSSTLLADTLYQALRDSLHHTSVIQWDERLTTREATRHLHAAGHRTESHRDRVDSAAATVMLESYLEWLHES